MLYSYNPNTGAVYNLSTGRQLGKTPAKDGYCYITANGLWKRTVTAQSFIWYIVHNELPDKDSVIDHIDRIKANNVLSNLRRITRSQNARNNSGAGVTYSKRDKLYVVQLKLHRKAVSGGCFKTLEEATKAAAFLRERLFNDSK